MNGLADELAVVNADRLAKVLGGISGDYDYSQGGEANAMGHYTDKGKMPWHPTFSNESVYSNADNAGGEWYTTDEGKWKFVPSQQQVVEPGYAAMLAEYYQNEKGKGIDTVEYPVPYKTPDKYKK